MCLSDCLYICSVLSVAMSALPAHVCWCISFSPSLSQIRNSFARLLLTVCQEANKDAQPYAYDTHFLRGSESPKSVFSYIVLSRLLELLKKEVPHFGRHLQQYFSFFMAYAFRSKTEVCLCVCVCVCVCLCVCVCVCV